MAKKKPESDRYPPEEAKRRFDAALKGAIKAGSPKKPKAPAKGK